MGSSCRFAEHLLHCTDGVIDRRLWGGISYSIATLLPLGAAISTTTAADSAAISRQDFVKSASSVTWSFHQQTAGLLSAALSWCTYELCWTWRNALKYNLCMNVPQGQHGFKTVEIVLSLSYVVFSTNSFLESLVSTLWVFRVYVSWSGMLFSWFLF